MDKPNPTSFSEISSQPESATVGPRPESNDLLEPLAESTSDRHFTSQLIHHGEQTGYHVTPISQDKSAPGYQRPGNLNNPTVATLLRKVMKMEGTEAAAAGSCGMSIISQTYLSLLKPGDRVVVHRCNYDWAMNLFRDYLPSWGVEVEFVDFGDPENLAKSLEANPAKFVHWEPYVNPTMEVLNTPDLIGIAKRNGASIVLDNTFLTPYLFQPFRYGADLVIHSVTKYIGGHGNAMGGVVSGSKELINKIEHAQNWLGGLLRPMDAFLVTQGVKTLPLRMQKHCHSAQMIAEFLQSHPAVEKVCYGGLSTWNHHLKSGPMKGFGGMMGIVWKEDCVHQCLGNQVELILHATSLGDSVTRIVTRQQEKERGIPQRYTRVSIGLEDPEDLIIDFKRAIQQCYQ